MAINRDCSTSHTVVVTCTDCPHWAAIRFGKWEGHLCAIDHEKTFHPESENARRAARDYRTRHAADSSNLPTPSAVLQA